MIELISLRFGNFRSFVDDQCVDFNTRGKLIQIDGRNENTGGSSGAGKSTIVMALDYLLGISDIPSTVLQSRLTKEGLWAEGEFLIQKVPVSIKRSKKEGLVIKTPGETISGNVKLAEEKLESLIGIPSKIFRKMIHKKQKEGGFFLNMSPKEIYEFLISVLGLEKYVHQIDKINENISNVVKDTEILQKTVELERASIKDMERILSEKTAPVLISDIEMPDLIGKINTLKSNLETIKSTMDKKIASIPQVDLIEADTSIINKQIADLFLTKAELQKKLNKIDESKTSVQSEINKASFLVPELQKIGEKILLLKKQKEHIQNSQCPTCLQKWIGNDASDKIFSIEQEIKLQLRMAKEFKAQIDEKPKKEENLNRLIKIKNEVNEQLGALQEQRLKLDAEKYNLMELANKKNQDEKDLRNKQISEIEYNYNVVLSLTMEELKGLEISLATLQSKKASYINALAQYNKETDSLKNIISKKQELANASEIKLINCKKQIAIADEAKRLIKGYVLQTFQETLDAIGESATNILATIPNMSTATVYFEGCKETKSGSIKDEVVAILNSDGNNEVPIKSLSGGERTAIDLAIDLAVIDVIESKASKGANFLFMDEPFDGLDSICKENCLEILKQFDTNKKIILIDHSSELKEMVSDVILVSKKGELSSIVV